MTPGVGSPIVRAGRTIIFSDAMLVSVVFSVNATTRSGDVPLGTPRQ